MPFNNSTRNNVNPSRSYTSAGPPSNTESGKSVQKVQGTSNWKFGGTPSNASVQQRSALSKSRSHPAVPKNHKGRGGAKNQLACPSDPSFNRNAAGIKFNSKSKHKDGACCCDGDTMSVRTDPPSNAAFCSCGDPYRSNTPNYSSVKEPCAPINFDAFPNPFRGPALPTPGWIAHCGRVLRFYAFYQEPIPESNIENYRIHQCEIRFFPEDGTMEVYEPKTFDAGFPQGRVIRRHRIPMPEPCDGVFGLADLDVGCQITLYGKTFFITGVDDRTRNYLNRYEGRPVMKNIEMPSDPYTNWRQDRIQSLFARKAGISLDQDKLKKFLANGGKVLRFWAYWDDRCKEGGLRHFIFHYFLEDDTVEIKEIVDPDGGVRGATSFLGKGRLLKDHKDLVNTVGIREEAILILNTNAGGRAIAPTFLTDKLCPGVDEKDFITDKDLAIGAVINVYGRPFILTDCDKATQTYYREKYGIENFTPLTLENSELEKPIPRMEPPPHIGIGDEADTLYNWNRTEPVPPPVNHLALLINDKDLLLFEARFYKPLNRVNEDRRFVIRIYMADNTMQIFEKPHPNTGLKSGTFLARSKVRKRGGRPNFELGEESEYYVTADYYVGNILDVNGFQFLLTCAQDSTYCYMENNIAMFPQSNLCIIMEKVREAVGPIEGEALLRAYTCKDVQLCGVMCPEDFRSLLVRITKGGLSEHEMTTILRAFRINGKPEIDFRTLKSAIQHELQRYNMDSHVLSRIEYTLRYHDPCRLGFVDRETLRATLKGALRPVNKILIDYLVDKCCIVDQCDRVNYCHVMRFMDWIHNGAPKIPPTHITCILKWLEPTPPKGKIFCVNYRAFLDAINPNMHCDLKSICCPQKKPCSQPQEEQCQEQDCYEFYPCPCDDDSEEWKRYRSSQVISDNRIQREELRCDDEDAGCCRYEESYDWNTPRMSAPLANAYMPPDCPEYSDCEPNPGVRELLQPSDHIGFEDLYTRAPIPGEFQIS